jgi:hypothetical protein
MCAVFHNFQPRFNESVINTIKSNLNSPFMQKRRGKQAIRLVSVS